MYPEDSLGLYDADPNAKQRPLGYIILDLALDTNEGLRFRTNIFPTEYTLVVYSVVGGEFV